MRGSGLSTTRTREGPWKVSACMRQDSANRDPVNSEPGAASKGAGGFDMLLKKLILSGGLLASLGVAAPAIADECNRPAPPAQVYQDVRYVPEYGGGYYDPDVRYYRDPYGYRDPYAEWRRREAWERHRRWEWR